MLEGSLLFSRDTSISSEVLRSDIECRRKWKLKYEPNITENFQMPQNYTHTNELRDQMSKIQLVGSFKREPVH